METMTFRSAMSVTLVACVACVACSGSGKQEGATRTKGDTTRRAGLPTGTPDSAAGAIATNGAGEQAGTTKAGDPGNGKLPANHNGKIPVLEYHVIGSEKNTLYTRTAASFRADLEDVYKRGYRPIKIGRASCRERVRRRAEG